MKKYLIEELNIGDKLEDLLFYNRFSIFFRKSFRFIKRLPTWIGLCWNQENWDIDYLYDLIEFKMKELLKAQEHDTIHLQKDVKRRIRQIKICLAYLDRYRNSVNYYDYPTDDIIFEPCENNCSKMIYTNKYNEIKRKGIISYEKFNYDMFWKRFLQWHNSWWV